MLEVKIQSCKYVHIAAYHFRYQSVSQSVIELVIQSVSQLLNVFVHFYLKKMIREKVV